MNDTLRQKTISKGSKISLYLDYYPPLQNPFTGKESRREFLGIYLIANPRTPEERKLNNTNKIKAQAVCSLRKMQIAEADYSFLRQEGQETDSIESLFNELIEDTHNPTSKYYYTQLPELITEYAKKFYKKQVLSWDMFTPEFCQGYINNLKTKKHRYTGEPLGRNTLACYSTSFTKFLNLAEKRDKIFNITNKIKGIQMDNAKKREHLSMEELKALLATPVKQNYQRCKELCLFIANTGIRKGDAFNLTWEKNIVQENGQFYIHFEQEKGARAEFLPLNEVAVNLMGERGKGKIFKGATYHKVTFMLPIWMKNAGIERHITMHSFRHTFATLLVKQGINMSVLMGLMGHKDIATTMRYSHVDTQDKQKAVNKLKWE